MSSLRLERDGSLALVRLDKGRGNAIDELLVNELRDTIHEIDADRAVRGLLLGSTHPSLFCPGLDLVTLAEYDRPALERFMTRFVELIHALYALEKPVVAAVSGHAVAGGCALALTADLRVLRRGAKIGLNEVKVGVPLPWSVATLLRASVTPGALTRAALLGSNFSDDEAVTAGMAHEVAEEEGFEALCRVRLEELAEKDPPSFRLTKRYLRAEALAAMKAHHGERAGEFLDAWFSPATQRRIRAMIESLAAKR